MPNRFDFGGVDLSAGESSSAARPSSPTPFCMAILGDFSGRASRGLVDAKTVGERRAILIDRDNFDEVLAGLKVELHLATAEDVPIVLRFSELDDFHPDRLFEHAAFRKLRELRARLQDPSIFKEVAQEMGLSARQGQDPGAGTVDDSAAPTPVRLASGSLLDELIEETETRGVIDRPARKSDDVRQFAQQVAAKYAVAARDPRQAESVATVDRAVSDVMSSILHHPDFQALEALWRAVFLLVRQLETGPQLKLYLFDISKAELAADLKASSDLRNTGIFRLLVEKGIHTPGADPWAVVVGNYTFGPDKNDLDLLSEMAKVAKQAGTPFLAGASSRLLGVDSLDHLLHPMDQTKPAGEWSELRRLPEADFIGLALPRFLIRLPYGEQTSPVESFDFEEFAGSPSRECYLWGNPAFVVSLLLAEAFSVAGWGMRPDSVAQLDRLPLYMYKVEGESVVQPCAEVLLTQDAVERILEEGIIPVISYKGRDSVRIARFQSIAQPPRALAGGWSQPR